MKKYILLVLMLSAFYGCVPPNPTLTVNNRAGVSNDTMSAIEPISKTVNYSIASDVQGSVFQAYEYGSNKTKLSKYSFSADVNKDVDAAVSRYMESKFLSTADKADYKVTFEIKDFYMEYSLAMGSSALLIMTNTYQSTENYKTVLNVAVTVEKSGNKYEKNFVIEQDSQDKSVEAMNTNPQSAVGTLKPRKGHAIIFSDMLTASYNDLIIRTDKFINAVSKQK